MRYFKFTEGRPYLVCIPSDSLRGYRKLVRSLAISYRNNGTVEISNGAAPQGRDLIYSAYRGRDNCLPVSNRLGPSFVYSPNTKWDYERFRVLRKQSRYQDDPLAPEFESTHSPSPCPLRRCRLFRRFSKQMGPFTTEGVNLLRSE